MAGIPDEDFFWTIHGGLPREGPGDNASTARALAMVSDLSPHARILDMACGPGMQTIALGGLCAGEIVALDTHLPFLWEVDRRARAANVGDRIFTVNGSMAAPPFAPGVFDLIWCEGAMYMLGIEQTLALWRPLLRARGFIGATHPCWLLENPPDAAKAFWASEGFAMTTAEAAIGTIRAAGYETVGHFVLPPESWWDDYYAPIEAKLPALREQHGSDPSALKRIDDARHEIDMHRRFGETYGYVFFVMRPQSD